MTWKYERMEQLNYNNKNITYAWSQLSNSNILCPYKAVRQGCVMVKGLGLEEDITGFQSYLPIQAT